MNLQYKEICNDAHTDADIALLRSADMLCPEEGRLSLYGVRLDGDWFYAVSAVSGDDDVRSAEMLGRDRDTAECIYGRLLRCGVTPEFLREIVFDQLDVFSGESFACT